MNTGAGIVRGDATCIPLADGSVHLSITSPPYFALRSYQDGGEHYGGQIGSEATPTDFLLALWAVADEVWRVLADGGSAWWNLGDKYAGSGGHNNSNLAPPRTGAFGTRQHNGQAPRRATRRNAPDRYNQAADVPKKSLMGLPWRFMMGLICPDQYRAPFEPAACWHDDGPGPCRTCPPRRFPQWVGRAEVVWAKPNGLPESVTDRPRRSHEQWFMVTKAGRCFAGIDEIREPHAAKTLTHRGGGQAHGNQRNPDNNFGSDKPRMPDPLGKLPGSVWSIPSAPLKVPDHLGVDHFAAFPPEWPRRIIAGWSPTGICTACGEGRRPVVTKEAPALRHWAQGQANSRAAPVKGGTGRVTLGIPAEDRRTTITGYACACPDPSAPTRPAVVLDAFGGTGTVAMMARAMGRFGVHVDLSRDYNRLASWRVFESGHGEKALEKARPKVKRRPRVRRVDRPLSAQVEQLELGLCDPPAVLDVGGLP